MRHWVRQLEAHTAGRATKIEKVLVANKYDMENDRIISPEVGQALAREYNMAFFEASAKTGYNIQEIFFHLAKAVKDKRDAEAAKGGAAAQSA